MPRVVSLLAQLLLVILAGTAVSSVQIFQRGLPWPLILSCYLVGVFGAGIAAYRLCHRAYPPTLRERVLPRASVSRYGLALSSAFVVAFLVFWASAILLVNTYGS